MKLCQILFRSDHDSYSKLSLFQVGDLGTKTRVRLFVVRQTEAELWRYTFYVYVLDVIDAMSVWGE